MKKRIFLILIIIITALGLNIVLNSIDTEKNNKTEVVFWSLQLNNFADYLNPIIAEFEKQNPDIKIQWIDVPYSEGEKRVLASLLSNSMPDLINVTSDFAKTLAQKGALEVIEENDVEIFNQQIMKSLEFQEGYTSLPFYATSAVTIYNTKLLKKAKITKVPLTFDELNQMSPVIKQRTGAYAQMPTLCENDTFLKILNKHGINNRKKLASDKSVEIFNTYKKLYTKRYIPKDSITQTHREVVEKYGSAQIVFMQAGANFLNLIKENSPTTYRNTDVSEQLTSNNGKYDFSLMNLAIPQKAKNKAAALKFALFLLNKKNQLDFAKLTPILPVNAAALSDEYFTIAGENDLTAKARVISAKQLMRLQPQVKIEKNQKEILNMLNLTTQKIMLNKTDTKEALNGASEKWETLEEN